MPADWDLGKFARETPEGTVYPQWEFVTDRSPTALWIGGRGSTKTSSAALRLMQIIRDPAYYGARIMVMAPVNKQLKRGPLEKFDEVFQDTSLILNRINGYEPRREMVNRITVYGFNVGPQGEGAEATRGAEYAIVWLDEAALMPKKADSLASATLRQKKRDGKPFVYQKLITTTPLGKNWVYRDYLADLPKGPGVWKSDNKLVVRSTTLELIRCGILPENYQPTGAQPGTLMWEQEALGEAISWAGNVFNEFNYLKHVPDPFILPELTHVYGGIDTGTVDPTAILLVGVDRKGGFWVFKEFYERRAKMSDWYDLVGQWTREYHVRKWFVDSAEISRSLNRPGISASFPDKSKDSARVAINFINDKLAKDQLHISPSCHNLIREMEDYRFKDEMTGDEPTILSTVRAGQDDHACFIAGTMISTPEGEIAIEKVKPGMSVLTRAGPRTVLAAQMTALRTKVRSVNFDNGRWLTGTSNHPVFVNGKGWKRLDTLHPPVVASAQDGAPVGVVASYALLGKQAVYNLSVEGENEYFASGVLVHNCDALRYAIKPLSSVARQLGHGQWTKMKFAGAA